MIMQVQTLVCYVFTFYFLFFLSNFYPS